MNMSSREVASAVIISEIAAASVTIMFLIARHLSIWPTPYILYKICLAMCLECGCSSRAREPLRTLVIERLEDTVSVPACGTGANGKFVG